MTDRRLIVVIAGVLAVAALAAAVVALVTDRDSAPFLTLTGFVVGVLMPSPVHREVPRTPVRGTPDP